MILNGIEEQIIVKNVTGNPAPLGLLGFGMTTVLLNLHNAGFFPMDAMILAMGLFYGGLGQLFVGLMEWKKNNTFGTIAFTSYGLFWISLCTIIILPKTGLAAASSPYAMGWFLTLWAIMSLGMFIGTFKTTKALSVVFGLLVILFSLLAIIDFSGSEAIGRFAGYEGILCGASAIYTAFAEILNEMYGKTILPLGSYK
jgi:succinate-acetate transporter protein